MRTLIRLVLILILVVGVGFLVLGYWAGSSRTGEPARSSDSVGTSGVIDTQKARERGAELGEKTAIAAGQIRDSVGEASLTGKIKAKMALDDTIKARAIDVSTEDRTVTLSGTVQSKAEHDRALALARETEGVSNVIDRLEVR
jgi:hyperosmotically inducible protein